MLVFILAVAGTTATGLHAQTFVFFDDFNRTTNSATQTWSYYSGVNVSSRNGSYTLDNSYDGNVFGSGLMAWSVAGTSYGFLGINPTANSVSGITTGGWAHPEQSGGVALGFRAPFAGAFSVSWSIANVEAGGDGIDWYLDRGTNNLASGIRTFADGVFNGSLTTNLSAGEFLYFVVGRNGSSYFYDTTQLNMSVVAVPEPPTIAILVSGLGVLVSVMHRRSKATHAPAG